MRCGVNPGLSRPGSAGPGSGNPASRPRRGDTEGPSLPRLRGRRGFAVPLSSRPCAAHTRSHTGPPAAVENSKKKRSFVSFFRSFINERGSPCFSCVLCVSRVLVAHPHGAKRVISGDHPSDLHPVSLWSGSSLGPSRSGEALHPLRLGPRNPRAREVARLHAPPPFLLPPGTPSQPRRVQRQLYTRGRCHARWLMSCQVVDKFVGDILKDLPFLVSDDPAVTSLVRQKEFDELVHWHPADPSVTTTTGQSVSSMPFLHVDKTYRQKNLEVHLALVNQVAATVQNRFNKNLPSGEALCGVFTRDYRHDALNSQVLVTVPACFEILLLAPHRQAWVKRIRYVIFDEPLYVHLLEPLLSFPVLYRERYNDLEKHVCSVRDGGIHFDHFHLCAVLTTDHEDSTMAKNAASQRPAGPRTGVHRDYALPKQSYKVRLVLYRERYNDLEKHVCSVRDGGIHFDHFHLCAVLTTDHESEAPAKLVLKGVNYLCPVEKLPG
ncbi:hypothetical protein CB1_000677008 [Camelus ferus]|nr:hypothetical protein CB1_000677008 [Camelus ferus]